MSGKAGTRNMLKGTYLNALPLIKQDCYLVLVEDRLILGDQVSVGR